MLRKLHYVTNIDEVSTGQPRDTSMVCLPRDAPLRLQVRGVSEVRKGGLLAYPEYAGRWIGLGSGGEKTNGETSGSIVDDRAVRNHGHLRILDVARPEHSGF